MFQLLSDVDIVLKLLAEWGIEPTRKLSATDPKRKYRVQYGESDYADLRAANLHGARLAGTTTSG